MKRKKCKLEEILGRKVNAPYQNQYQYVRGLVEEGKIQPVQSSEKNGKKPALYTKYWVFEEEKDYSAFVDELSYQIHSRIQIDYYMKHLDVYEIERENVLLLNDFLQKKSDRLLEPCSYNERCMEIWGYEKFLSKDYGKKLLEHCGWTMKDLNCYPTVEPFPYFTLNKKTPQKILIIENKDTFFSMRKCLMEGKEEIFGERVGTLIYGAGKRIISSFKEFLLGAEPYMLNEENEFLYFGDLDYEGIGIYENLADVFGKYGTLRPYLPAYRYMLKKREKVPKLPVTKENQNQNISTAFFSYFDKTTVDEMQDVLKSGLYIPQEILNITDF